MVNILSIWVGRQGAEQISVTSGISAQSCCSKFLNYVGGHWRPKLGEIKMFEAFLFNFFLRIQGLKFRRLG